MRYTTRIIVPPKVRRSGAPGAKDNRYAPQVIGVRKSFGFGDLLGVAAPGQIRAASAHRDWTPFFAQQSVEEIALTGRSAPEVMRASVQALETAGFRQPWGADADRLKTPMDVEAAAEAGFTYYTIDPTDFIRRDAETLPADSLDREVGQLVEDGELPENWLDSYLGRFIDLPGDWRLELTREPLLRAALKFGRALQHCSRMYEAVTRSNRGRPFEIEVCLDGTASPATPLEHLFAGLELEARQVRVTSLGLRLIQGSGAEIGERGTSGEFEERLRGHMAVAQFCGPYKLSFRGGEDQLGVYPILGRLCGEQLHVKTSGTSYLAALRAVLRLDADLFMEFVRHGQESLAQAGQGLGRVGEGDAESVFLDQPAGRRLLLAALPILWAGQTASGRTYKDAILEVLNRRPELPEEIVAGCYEKQLSSLSAG